MPLAKQPEYTIGNSLAVHAVHAMESTIKSRAKRYAQVPAQRLYFRWNEMIYPNKTQGSGLQMCPDPLNELGISSGLI